MSDKIQDYGQSLAGLELAYACTYNKSLESRIYELYSNYGNRVDQLYCELDNKGEKPTPCQFPLSVLVEHYKTELPEKRRLRELYKLRAAIVEFLRWNDRNGDYHAMTVGQAVEAIGEVWED